MRRTAAWLAVLVLASCAPHQVCREAYMLDQHPSEPHVLVRKCIVCRSPDRLPNDTCYAGIGLPLGATVQAWRE